MNLSPIGWALRPLKNYADFSGRASRAEFWWFFLFIMVSVFAMYMVLIVTMVGAAAGASGAPPSAGLLGAIGIVGIGMLLLWLAMFIPMLAVQVRRLHDTGRSGWWLGGYWLLYLVYLAMLVGSIGTSLAGAAGGVAAPPDASGPLFIATTILGLVMFIYAIALLVFFCLPGTPGANRFGPDPYGSDVGEVFA